MESLKCEEVTNADILIKESSAAGNHSISPARLTEMGLTLSFTSFADQCHAFC